MLFTRNKLILHFYTDGDFAFNNHEIPYDQYKSFEVFDYADHQFSDYHYCFSFEFADDEISYVIAFLKQLELDLYYGDSHDWIVKQLHEMIQPAIDFLKEKKKGIFHSTLRDGNWQPSDLFIIVEDE